MKLKETIEQILKQGKTPAECSELLQLNLLLNGRDNFKVCPDGLDGIVFIYEREHCRIFYSIIFPVVNGCFISVSKFERDNYTYKIIYKNGVLL
jgi:hypothetical protein